VQSGSVLQLLHRLRGGGGDGGATGAESRSSYLEMYMDKKPDKVRALQPFSPDTSWVGIALLTEQPPGPVLTD